MKHYIYFNPAQKMSQLKDKSIDLVVTSPPYPMIEMWDEIMANQNPQIRKELTGESPNPRKAFELMHRELDKVWAECWRVMKDGSFLCINIGDATRTINKEFALYNNSTRIIMACEELGFVSLPNIIWKKTSNAPNKFMGSGMLPCGAYVTLEHEWILIFRKGGKREYRRIEEKNARRNSSFFWEERNVWFSDVWEIKGVKQTIDKSPTRERNASFPLELPFRLINMYSQKNDIVLDPFMGLGTTGLASILSERNSVGYEIDPLLKPMLYSIYNNVEISKANGLVYTRYLNHKKFIDERVRANKEVKHYNAHINCKVMTAQETDLNFHYIQEVKPVINDDYICFESTYQLNRNIEDLPIYESGTIFEGF